MLTNTGGIRFDIHPQGQAWLWTTFDLRGAPLNSGQAGSKREAAAFVIREIMRAGFAGEPQLAEAA